MADVLVTSAVLQDEGGRYRELLEAAGFTIRYSGLHGDELTERELIRRLDRVVATVAGNERYTSRVLESAPDLRVIARTGVGYDSVDVEAASARGVAVAITPGTNHDSVAEQTMALLLGVCKQVVPNHHRVIDGTYARQVTVPLRGKTLGIVGLGRAGKAMAARALAFLMRVQAYDPVLVPEAFPPGVVRADLDTLLTTSDVISLHAPLLAETRRFIGTETIPRMKRGVILVNTARGALVDEAALAAALHSGQVGAAALDVTEREPPIGSPLLDAPNILFAPHLAGIDSEAIRQMAEMAAETIVDLSAGRWPIERIVNHASISPWCWDPNGF